MNKRKKKKKQLKINPSLVIFSLPLKKREEQR